MAVAAVISFGFVCDLPPSSIWNLVFGLLRLLVLMNLCMTLLFHGLLTRQAEESSCSALWCTGKRSFHGHRVIDSMAKKSKQENGKTTKCLWSWTILKHYPKNAQCFWCLSYFDFKLFLFLFLFLFCFFIRNRANAFWFLNPKKKVWKRDAKKQKCLAWPNAISQTKWVALKTLSCQGPIALRDAMVESASRKVEASVFKHVEKAAKCSLASEENCKQVWGTEK